MKTQYYTVLARRSQSGDAVARKKLLMESYMRIAYQCRHILLNHSVAETITRDILRTLHKTLEELEKPEDYLLRMQELIAEKTAFWLAERDWGTRGQSAGKPITLPGKLLDENQTASFVVRLVDDLSAEQRICMILKHCGEMEHDAISIFTGISYDTVQKAIERGENAIHQRLDGYRQHDIKFLGLGSLDLMLTGAMESSRNEMTAAAVAESIMGTIRPKKMQSAPAKAAPKKPVKKAPEKKPEKEVPAEKPKKTKKKAKKKKSVGLIAAIVIVLIALIGLVAFALYLEWEHQDDWMLYAVPQFVSRMHSFL